MKLTTLQIKALEWVYRNSLREPNHANKPQSRVLNKLRSLDLIQTVTSLTNKGLDALNKAKPELFEKSNLVGREVFEQINYFEPIDLIVQRHIDNMINTYGQEQVMRYIELRKAS